MMKMSIITKYQVVKETKEVAIVGEEIEEEVEEAAGPLHGLGQESNDFANKNGDEDDPSVIGSGSGAHRRRRCLGVGVHRHKPGQTENVPDHSVTH